MVIRDLVKSAFQTGCLSVESEALLRQVLSIRGCAADRESLTALSDALKTGQIRREARQSLQIPF